MQHKDHMIAKKNYHRVNHESWYYKSRSNLNIKLIFEENIFSFNKILYIYEKHKPIKKERSNFDKRAVIYNSKETYFKNVQEICLLETSCSNNTRWKLKHVVPFQDLFHIVFPYQWYSRTHFDLLDHITRSTKVKLLLLSRFQETLERSGSEDQNVLYI